MKVTGRTEDGVVIVAVEGRVHRQIIDIHGSSEAALASIS